LTTATNFSIQLPDYPITRLPNPGLLQRLNADHAAVRAVILEFHAPRDLRKDRVVFAEARVEPRSEPAATLPHDDRAAAHHVPVVRLHAEPLGVGVAAVACAALSFFMSHGCDLEENLSNAHARVGCAMPLRPAHSLAALRLEYADL